MSAISESRLAIPVAAVRENPAFWANAAFDRLRDAASRHTSVTVDEARASMRNVLIATLGPDAETHSPAAQNAFFHTMLTAIEGQRHSLPFQATDQAEKAWRAYCATRDATYIPEVAAQLRDEPGAIRAAAFERLFAAYDRIVIDTVSVLALGYASAPIERDDGFAAARGDAAVRSFTTWQQDEGRRLQGLPPMNSGAPASQRDVCERRRRG